MIESKKNQKNQDDEVFGQNQINYVNQKQLPKQALVKVIRNIVLL